MKGLLKGIGSVDRRIVFTLLYLACALTLIEFFYLPPRVQLRIDGTMSRISLQAGLTWAWATSIAYLLPTLWTLLRGETLASIGYRWKGFSRHIWIYLGLYLFMVPFIFFAASKPAFARTYPFADAARENWTSFCLWEASYLFQFLALEAFFRGYLLFTLERRFGWNAVFILVVPYMMIHYHKPFLEAAGAMVAGTVLGALALRLRSFFGGVVLHGLVGLTMDLLGAHRSGLF